MRTEIGLREYQYFIYDNNMFIIGGRSTGSRRDYIGKSYVMCFKTCEVDVMACMDRPKFNHTVHHVAGEIKAYVCGGMTNVVDGRFTNDEVFLKKCLVFDIFNQKFKHFGHLNAARSYAGVVTCKKYLWVFGGIYR